MLTFCFWHLFLGKRSLDKSSPDYVPSAFSFRRNSQRKPKKIMWSLQSFCEEAEVNLIYRSTGRTTLEEVNNELGPSKIGEISVPVNHACLSVDQAVQAESQTSEDEGIQKKSTLHQKITSKQNVNF